MRGRPLQITWYHTADELAARLERECNWRRRERLLALLMIRRGATIGVVSETLNVNYRSVQRWVSWYRTGGLEAVLRRTPGYAAPGRPSLLTPEQTRELVRRYEDGCFEDAWAARDWVAEKYGAEYSYTGIYALLRRERRRSSDE